MPAQQVYRNHHRPTTVFPESFILCYTSLVEKKSSPDGIVLLAKRPGPTSFASLNSVKKALNTNKVGHTGTLDSFAQGLLVVCTGRLTKLAGNITAFDKSYQAVIHFGQETDTLEFTGSIIKEAPLPTEGALRAAVEKISQQTMQVPPAFSAIHINGERASDLARKGQEAQIPARKVKIYKAEIKELKANEEGLIEYALIDFSVSKGTYIRSLARDIAYECGSAAHLTGLYRTKVGNFNIEDSAGFNLLKDFSIEEAITQAKAYKADQAAAEASASDKAEKKPERKPFVLTPEESALQEEIRTKLRSFDKATAAECGFESINIASTSAQEDFFNGKKITSSMFTQKLWDYPVESQIAVFNENKFLGLIYKDQQGRPGYKFVLN